MKKTIIFLAFLFYGSWTMACPFCIGQTAKDKYYIYVTSVFCVSVFVPMYFLFRTFSKYKNINNEQKK